MSSIYSEHQKIEAIRPFLEDKHLFFCKYFFKLREGVKFKINWHHKIVADALEAVIRGDIKRLIINVPPGSSKTELAVINFIARGLALNPRSRFLHLSYSSELAELNSGKAKELISSAEYQKFFKIPIKTDSNARGRWNVVDEYGISIGGCYATSTLGQVTGFRAGNMAEDFQGAIIVDDPNKASDSVSKLKLETVNKTFINTVRSRCASPDTPIIVIMQRLAVDDLTGFLLAGGSGEEWTHIKIPATIGDTESYWPEKETFEQLMQFKSSGSFTYAGQYMQEPYTLGGDILKGEHFIYYEVLPAIEYRMIYADTAQKTKEKNDFSVLECWGKGRNGVYLIDLIRGKWEAPELERRTIQFWNKHKALTDDFNTGQLRGIKVEDKASGTGLIQKIKNDNNIPISGIQRNIDKLTRVMDIVGFIESGYVYLPEDAPWVVDFIAECEAFNADFSHKNDDQIDPMCDAISEMMSKKPSIYDNL